MDSKELLELQPGILLNSSLGFLGFQLKEEVGVELPLCLPPWHHPPLRPLLKPAHQELQQWGCRPSQLHHFQLHRWNSYSLLLVQSTPSRIPVHRPGYNCCGCQGRVRLCPHVRDEGNFDGSLSAEVQLGILSPDPPLPPHLDQGGSPLRCGRQGRVPLCPRARDKGVFDKNPSAESQLGILS